MNCYLCHTSCWMQEKVFTFLQNLLKNYNEPIHDSDVFLPLEYEGANELLSKLVHEKMPKELIEDLSTHRHHDFLLKLDDDAVPITLSGLWNIKEHRHYVHDILPEMFKNALEHSREKLKSDDLFRERIAELQKTLKLSEEEIDIFLCTLTIKEGYIYYPGIVRGERFSKNIFLISKCLNTSESTIMRIASPDSPLRRLQCLDDDLDTNSDLFPFLNSLTNEPLANSYFKKDTSEVLPWNDFGDLAKKHGEILKRMLSSGDKPINILLYGAPGTGKTSFAQSLAHELGRIRYCIVQNTNERGGRAYSSSDFRFAALQICNGQITPQESIIIVDEADEMLRGKSGFGAFSMLFGSEDTTPAGDKGLLNTVLDTMKTSTIWITNTPARALDTSSRRRFDYSICFEPLNCEQRKRIWKNNVARLNMGRLISRRQLEEFSALYPVSAGGISKALENLEKMQPRQAEVPRLIEQLLKPHCELLGIKLTDDKLLPSKDYSLEGLNILGDVQLEQIVEAVRVFMHQKGKLDPDRPRMNLLLSGAPGTGKTEFVKYLGNILKTKVNVKMGSDLLSMWVGGTEQNIAAAFRQAEAEHTILFLDEIDGMVQSRTSAQRSWEVTCVNELLHQMENFNGVMIGATNFIQNMDQAIMRRFTFKLQFNYLDNDGKRIFFLRMFKSPLTEDEQRRLNSIQNLAPGDFRTVRQSLFYYGGKITNVQRLDALEREAEAKNYSAFAPKAHIGF